MYGMSDAIGPSVDNVKNRIKSVINKKIKEYQMVRVNPDVIAGLKLAMQCLDEVTESDFN